MSQFSNVKDPELRKKLEKVAAEHEQTSQSIPAEVDQYPRFVFSRATPGRAIGQPVRVRNGLDEEPRGGTIVGELGRAYQVDLGDGQVLIVHEPDDSWE